MAPKKKIKSTAETKQLWVRTGGAIGDQSMSKLDAYLADGCGVDETITGVDCEPNEEFLGSKPMSDHVD